MTENWVPAGVGGRDNRGWGAVVHSPAVASALARLYDGDAGWRDTTPWRRFRAGRQFRRVPPANGTYPERRAPKTVPVRRVGLLTAPENAEGGVVGIVDNASTRVDVIQPTLGGLHQPFVCATVRAAARGVRVRILLSPAWYDRKENRALAERLNGLAARRNLSLSVRVARSGVRFGKVHAEGVVADDTAVVGSLNWNNNSARRNREVALALTGPRVADYYRGSFEADWRASVGAFGGAGGADGGGTRLPAGLLVAVGLAALATLAAAERLEFER